MTQPNLKNGQLVLFVSPRSSWCYGTVNNVVGRDVTVEACEDQFPGGEIGILTVPVEAVQVVQNIESVEEMADDLLSLTNTLEADVFQNLRRRYYHDLVYTSIQEPEHGRILIHVNPNSDEIDWYKNSEMPLYFEQSTHNLPRHVWEIAKAAVDDCHNNSVNQLVIPSGDSGSGKTESICSMVNFICSYTSSEVMGKKVSAAYGILEAFTNAVTPSNCNASRSAVLTEMFLSDTKQISSIQLKLLYLEESRLRPMAGSGGQTFHAFYSILSSEAASKLFSLDRFASRYPTLNIPEQGAPAPAPPLSSEEGADGERLTFRFITSCFETLQIKESERWSVWAVVAAILQLYRIQFIEKEDIIAISDTTTQFLKHAACALAIPAPALESILLSTTFKIRGEAITRRHTERQAHTARDTLCVFLYSNCVSWLVSTINSKLQQTEVPPKEKLIRFIDIPGFELQQENGLDQLTINTANEMLQNKYNEDVLKSDMTESRSEELTNPNCYVAYQSNSGTVQMVSGSGGMFALMDECYDPEAEPEELDQKFLLRLTDTFERHKSYTRRQLDRDCFRVNHYAAEATYTVKFWCSKRVQPATLETLANLTATSKDSSVSKMHRHQVDMSNRHTLFTQLSKILDTPNSKCNWIRCLKPNVDGKRLFFEGNLMMSQIKCLGILETLTLKKNGYPMRLPYQDFVSQFGSILNFTTKSASPLEITKAIFSFVGISCSGDFAPAQLGVTKVFLKRNAYSILESARMSSLESHILILQRFALAKLSNIEKNNAVLRCNEAMLKELTITVHQRFALAKTHDKSRSIVVDKEGDARKTLEMHVVGEWRSLQDQVWENTLQETEIRNKKERLRKEKEARQRLDRLELQEMAVQEQQRQLSALKTAMSELENCAVAPIQGVNVEVSPQHVRDSIQLQLLPSEYDRLERLEEEKRSQAREYRLRRLEEEQEKKSKLEKTRARQQTAAQKSLEIKEREQVEKLRKFSQNEEKRRRGYIDVHRTHTALRQGSTLDSKIQAVRQRREQQTARKELEAGKLRHIHDDHQREKQIWRETIKAMDKELINTQRQNDAVHKSNLQAQRENLNKSISRVTHKVMAQRLVDDTLVATALDMERKKVAQQRKRDQDNIRLIKNAEKAIHSEHINKQKSVRLSNLTNADRRAESAARESQQLATDFIRRGTHKDIPSPLKSPPVPAPIPDDTYARLLGETAVREGILAAISTHITAYPSEGESSPPAKISKPVTWRQ
eukprot:TRINITY_DN6342_c2_g1_i1.p1 TRINITY_DN6342_c2_g1~~TRINITY_DN6342_c2_g1_i1.p1  ORF type:complete len:1245 (+),score=214.45 TRINITY_DN6342_c2_g1_i1:27-3761(+)